MAKLSKLKPGQTLWTVSRGKLGNTTISTVHVHSAIVKEIHANHAVISWNGNRPERVYEHALSQYKTSEPCTVPRWNGWGARMANREERKAILAERKAKEVA